MKTVPYFLISIRPEQKEKHEEFHGRISLMRSDFREISTIEFSKSKKRNVVYIDFVSVESEYKNKGYGKMMISMFECLMRILGHGRCFTDAVTEEGQILLERCGFAKRKNGKYYKSWRVHKKCK